MFILDMVCVQVAEIIHADMSGGSLIVWDTLNSTSALIVLWIVYITWKPSPSSFLKVNFDGCVLDGGRRGGASFVIRGPNFRVVAIGESSNFDTSALGVDQRAA